MEEETTILNRRASQGAEAGVTLIEMLVVVTIMALFIAIVGPRLLARADSAKVTAARTEINELSNALALYKLDTGSFPSTEQGLQGLRVQPDNVAQWQGPYLQKDVPQDPWGHPYVYKFPGEHGDEPDISSYGADGQPGGDGNNQDILSWKDK
ncbi:MAG TPA: type II secretion system major pseudopilin GspG [Bryobacteraceae bacterium]|jgi:general secretion pathway protein G|nr:type II secretion system major pseudopilin GspG [Bryobacteraceae bacterium]